MKCHGEWFWRQPAIGNPDGAWDPIMDCSVCRNTNNFDIIYLLIIGDWIQIVDWKRR